MAEKLTKSAIDRATYTGDGKSRDVRWDESFPGFGIRLFPSGKKSFVLFYRAQGRQRLMTVGRYGPLTLEDARKRARALSVSASDGKDPLGDKQKAAAGEHVTELCRDYMERYAVIRKKSWKEDARLIKRYILPAWASHQVRQIKRSDVAALHHRIGKTSHYEANRTLSLASKMFELARTDYGFLDENAANPARGIKKHPEVKRDRWVTQDELPALIQSINREPNVYVRSAFWLYLFTGLRKSELLEAEWTQVDMQRGLLRLPDTKSGKSHTIPLSPPALAVLRRIPPLKDNPFVFPGHLKGRPLVGIWKNWHRIRNEAGIPDVRIHDLRRTVGSWLAQSGSSLQLIGKVLNHSNTATTQIYAHLADTQVRAALDLHATSLLDVLKRSSIGTEAKVESPELD